MWPSNCSFFLFSKWDHFKSGKCFQINSWLIIKKVQKLDLQSKNFIYKNRLYSVISTMWTLFLPSWQFCSCCKKRKIKQTIYTHNDIESSSRNRSGELLESARDGMWQKNTVQWLQAEVYANGTRSHCVKSQAGASWICVLISWNQ